MSVLTRQCSDLLVFLQASVVVCECFDKPAKWIVSVLTSQRGL